MRLPCRLIMGLSLTLPLGAAAQDAASPPVIDTIIIDRDNVFTKAQAEGSFAARAGNAIHLRTRRWLIKSTVLFEVGDTLSMSRIRESERVLRNLNLFQEVTIDTATQDGRFAVLITTQDAWSLSPKFSIAGSSGSLTLTLGISDKNLLGTGSLFSIAYVKLVDRDGVDLSMRVPRFGSTRLAAGGTFQDLSAGNTGSWDAGVPYRAFPDPWAAQLLGKGADELRFRWRQDSTGLDSLDYDHNLLSHHLTTSIAANHSSRRYLRLGFDFLLRTEEYVLQTPVPAPVTDTTTATPGLTFDFRKAHYVTGRFYQGFGQAEDIDLSPSLTVKAWVAVDDLGYPRTGIGPEIKLSAGKQIGATIMVGSIQASGLFSGVGIDSGQVVFRGTWAAKLSEKQMAFIHVETGAMKGEAPGTEFDLGLTYGPRTFGAHAFVGNRTLWGTLEYRNYRWDSVFGFLGLGYAAFVDYGGAWYADQDRRFGGNVGLGLRFGSSIGSRAAAARFDLGYRFGNQFEGNRLGVSFGASYDIFTGLLPAPQ